MHGGIKFYRGNPAGARSYLEADHSRADDYYLAEGSGIAARYTATVDRRGVSVEQRADLDAPTYERWVNGYDVDTSHAKGRISNHENALRFVEVVVNGPKTWSIAASLHPEISAAYDAAQDRAADEIIGWLAEHSTTRVGPKGRQVQVPVERGLEAAVVRHYTSRTGDPHRHLHLQINAKVFAVGQWRALHSVGARDSIEAINGIGHAAVMCDPGFRAALAAHGYTLDDAGEVHQLKPYVGRFSQRSAQISRNVGQYEAEWRSEHPGQDPGPQLRRTWDRRAWADARPDKIVPTDGAELVDRWHEELHELGFRNPTAPEALSRTTIGSIRRDVAVDLILSRLGSMRSAWNAADIRGEAEKIITTVGIVAERAVRVELAEDLTDRAVAACRPILKRVDAPEHVRTLTSDRVLAVESDLNDGLAHRAELPVGPDNRVRGLEQLDTAQQEVVRALAGQAGLLVIEGAAGAGKTTTLGAAQEALEARDRRLVVVTPTLKAAQAAQQQVGTDAFSAAWLIHQHGYRWDEDGHWSQLEIARHEINPSARLLPGDVLLIDEAGMLDQDTARALFAVADRAGATIALLGDRHQLPAVGRGGVLDLAARWVRPEAHLELESVHRFTDPAYADLSLLMRIGERPGDVFDALVDSGRVVIHASEVERTAALASIGAAGDQLVIADTREQVASLNAVIRDRRTGPGERTGEPVTRRGERIGLGDRIATRRNDRDLGVANRDTWVVAGTGDDGSLLVVGRAGQRELPAAYVDESVELAFATTAYGAQGDTVDEAHLVIGETTGAATAYVGMTRGRDGNTAHLVAESVDDARRQWVDVFSRDRADLGPSHAAKVAEQDIDRYGPQASRLPASRQAAMLQTGVRRPPERLPGTPAPANRGIGR
ncbi:relaxase domain-containing protein [Nocardioides sp. JQ2195]|uniref:MobF family relaxase n=1 Tax=Nocardioides sp. JQ2195 TaxID=2592334 RepID=UPI00143E0F52|nr:MobF family relaxase [Nocardioides sp. JQ2195]QIX25178.1 relaxase domain-containing protein [Nocardioides sp. JQ2195]